VANFSYLHDQASHSFICWWFIHLPGEVKAEGDFMNVYKYLQRECRDDGARLF